MNYSHILLDLDGTVFDFFYAEKKAFFKLCHKFSIDANDDMYEFYKKVNAQRWKDYELGLYPKNEIVLLRFEDFFKKYNIHADSSVFNDCYMQFLTQSTKLFEGAFDSLQEIKSKYVLAAVTNANPKVQAQKLKMTGIDKIFDKVFISEEIGAPKPKKEFFDAVFNYYTTINKNRFLVVGDSLSADIKGACQSGLDSVWIKTDQEFSGDYKPTYIIDNINELSKLLEE